jgi:hypothetical protein
MGNEEASGKDVPNAGRGYPNTGCSQTGPVSAAPCFDVSNKRNGNNKAQREVAKRKELSAVGNGSNRSQEVGNSSEKSLFSKHAYASVEKLQLTHQQGHSNGDFCRDSARSGEQKTDGHQRSKPRSSSAGPPGRDAGGGKATTGLNPHTSATSSGGRGDSRSSMKQETRNYRD